MSYPLIIDKLSDSFFLECKITLEEKDFEFWFEDRSMPDPSHQPLGFIHISQVRLREADEFCLMVDGEPYLHLTRYRDEYFATSSDMRAAPQTLSIEQYFITRRREAERCQSL